VDLLSVMLHAAVRGLNSLADLETLQGFNEKYFGAAAENRNPTLLEALRFEEEVLRQKITWREKYETVIAGWLASKGRPKAYKTEPARSRKPATATVTSVPARDDPEERVKDRGADAVAPVRTATADTVAPVVTATADTDVPKTTAKTDVVDGDDRENSDAS